ncbi:hypothetical protein IC582_005430 [Cucumis melo]
MTSQKTFRMKKKLAKQMKQADPALDPPENRQHDQIQRKVQTLAMHQARL